MICPFCNHEETRVVDSRDTNDGRAIRRRRECEKCNARFSTYEEMEITKLSVIKRSGEKVEYDQNKVIGGLRKALEKRPITEDRLERILSEIEHRIYSKGRSEIKSREIGKIILEKLKEVDDVAYLRFASVYKSFGSAGSFRKELSKLEEK